jgi:KDO2-lipid IV(A) lauroyltransferase
MTQALNDSLSARVSARPDQWFWVHRRWKPARQAKYFAPEDDDLPEVDSQPVDDRTA